MTDRYILAGHMPMPEPDLMRWAQWYERAERHVDDTSIGAYRISTVFLGLDHRLRPGGPPVLFETMVFDNAGGVIDQDRYGTWDEAAAGHARWCALVRGLAQEDTLRRDLDPDVQREDDPHAP